MAFNKRQSRKIIDHVRAEDAPGLRMDPGPHIGIVKHVVDSTRTGRLIVYLPHLGGDPDDVHNQRIVQYASPYFGHTSLQENPNGVQNTNNTFETVRHTYGMWMTPPDVGVKVLVVFEAGDANNGYWFACIPPTAEHNMAGSSGGVAVEQLEKDNSVAALLRESGAKFAPAVEYNAASYKVLTPGVLSTPRPPHRIQTKILAEQGLLADPNRGIDDATAMRESPSGVFGITTPGRPNDDQVTDELLRQVSENAKADTSKLKEKIDNGRKGGHQFVMDDGDVDGHQRRIKLRSAAGNQIILDDTNGMIYVSNATGNVWFELTHDGQVYMYGADDINIRSGKDINIKADKDLNIHVGGNMNVKVDGDTQTSTTNEYKHVNADSEEQVAGHKHTTVDSDYALSVNSAIGIKSSKETIINSNKGGWAGGASLQFDAGRIDLNSGSPGSALSANVPSKFSVQNLNDTVKVGNVWKHEQPSEHTSDTILPKIPTHEPYSSRSIPPFINK